jgi:hypothetical protein
VPRLRIHFLAVFAAIICSVSWSQITPKREQQLLEDYDSFLKRLDPKRIAADYALPVRDVQSKDCAHQERGVRVLGTSGEVDAIPWIVPLLDSACVYGRVYAGWALQEIISKNELLRRDPSHLDTVRLLPRSPNDIDLRPLAWLILQMMRAPDDGNTASYAATMAGYLELREFLPELKLLLKSRHPAVTNSAIYALELIERDGRVR